MGAMNESADRSTGSDDGLPAALFVPEGDDWRPTELGRGPWDRGALHGGAVAAFMVRALERCEAPVEMRLARVTLELLRPVTLDPVVVDVEVVRPGAKVSLLEATLTRVRDTETVARARALRIRTAELDFGVADDDVPPVLPDADVDVTGGVAMEEAPVAFHTHAVRHRFSEGMFGVAGSAFDWIRLAVPVVPGEDPTGWQRAAAAADFGNGISSVVPFDGSTLFINPDLTVHLWREPVGEWVGMDSRSHVSTTGIGGSDSAMWDEDGRIGRTNQSLLFDRL